MPSREQGQLPQDSNTIPLRSPFRYPGGKTWFVPYVRRWLQTRPQVPVELIEPFAGGAIVGLTVAFENLAKKVTLVERDPDVAAVWHTILDGRAEWLADRIANFKPTPSSVSGLLNSVGESLEERAFATIVRNRVQRGGILAPGAGLMKQGENGKGLASRWYPQTICQRILAIAEMKDRIRFIEDDGLKYVQKNSRRKEVAYFIDPPYTIASKRLYKYSDNDHRHLFGLAANVRGDFLMTYDNSKEIRRLAREFTFTVKQVPMQNAHHRKKFELLIGKDLEWLNERILCRSSSV